MNKILFLLALCVLAMAIVCSVVPGAQKRDDYRKSEAMYAQTPNPPPR